MDCNQRIMSEENYDFITQYSRQAEEIYENNPNVCVQHVNPNWLIVSGPLYLGTELNISEYGYLAIPKLYALMDTTSMESSGIISVQNQPALGLKGQGVIIGIIDTGIDYTHEVFQFAKGLSKIDVIWDQTINYLNGRIDNKGYDEIKYGTVYTNDEINAALQAADNGEDPYQIVASRDEIGHGTFMAGIAGGNRIGEEFTGAAPDATLAIVKLKPAKQYLRDFYLVRDEAIAYQETDIMMGIRFLEDVAVRLGKPLVICLGVGTNNGPHTGITPMGNILNTSSDNFNQAVVVCVGNESNMRHHYSGIKSEGELYDTVEINVGRDVKGFYLELWGRSPEVFSVSITSATGEVVPRIPTTSGRNTKLEFIFERTVIYIDYKVIETISGDEVIFIRFEEPTEGIWKINVYGVQEITGTYNMWLPVTEFVGEDVYFVEPSPNTTITEPSAANRVISVAAYDHRNDSIYIHSGRGYTTDGRVIPEIAAPGVDVYGPEPNNRYAYRSGTSIAAAHVAGVSAQLLEWGVMKDNAPLINTSDIKTILIRGAKRNPFLSYPNREYGYGILDVMGAFRNMSII